MPPDLLHDLHRALTAVTVRAWRLRLHTPEMCVTVAQLRHTWGRALREIAPAVHRDLFEGGADDTPRYLLRPARGAGSASGEVEFLLFGPTYAGHDEPAWDAWELAGQTGIGPDRVPFQILALHPLAWDGTALTPAYRQPGFGLYPLPWPAGCPDRPCRLTFPAPLRLVNHGRLVLRPTLADLTLAALRRVQVFAGVAAAPLGPARSHWGKVAEAVPARPWEAGPDSDSDANLPRDAEGRGVAGALTLPEGPGPLADLLAAACWLHLGKGTVLGLGRLVVTAAEEETTGSL